ncbi:tyrosine-type recombinase/integrase [Desulfovibrio psychrotolerans]|uniref:Tyr recombinase domain-containing protein n=1 Tax=Desulfovibrio psychrotolerans TaxID=415242 RepID=A0A7J0BV65_9BACT|nr:site-specific integrase [Desulfovibrio psychrotolerans]GFM36904.1 hypothetical protein DSM19430T_15880 [Desulfovibrio psychrotolerans]
MAVREYKGKGGNYKAYFKLKGKQYSQVVKTKREGEEWIVQERKLLKAQCPVPKRLMYSDAARRYLCDCKARMQPTTVAEKYAHLTEFGTYTGGDIAVEGVTVSFAKKFIAHTQAEKGNKSANRRLRTMKACWNWFKDEQPDNPWKNISMYPEEEVAKYVPPPEDVAAVRLAAAPWQQQFLDVLLTTGARLGEIMNLTWEDVNLERKRLSLWTRKRKGGAKQSRILPISPKCLPIFKQLWEERDRQSRFVFTNPETGGQFTKLQPRLRYMLERLCRKVGVKPFGFHSLRHYVSQRLMDSGKATLTDIQLLLGHQRATTTDIYLRSLSSSISHLAEILDEEVVPQAPARLKSMTRRYD